MSSVAYVTPSDVLLSSHADPVNWLGCGFAPDMALLSQNGLVPAAWLRAGDLVKTRDNGLQPLAMVERLSGEDGLMVRDETLCGGVPLPASQRALATGWKLEMNFGEDEMLVALGAFDDVRPFSAQLSHAPYLLAFEEPQIVYANGLWLEAACMAATKPARPHLTGIEARAAGLTFEDLAV